MTTPHALTLMEPQVTTTGPAYRLIECPMCHQQASVDWQLTVRGEYYCDGDPGTVRYVRHDKSKPGILEVLADEQLIGGQALDELALIISDLGRDLRELELWVYTHAKPNGE